MKDFVKARHIVAQHITDYILPLKMEIANKKAKLAEPDSDTMDKLETLTAMIWKIRCSTNHAQVLVSLNNAIQRYRKLEDQYLVDIFTKARVVLLIGVDDPVDDILNKSDYDIEMTQFKLTETEFPEIEQPETFQPKHSS